MPSCSLSARHFWPVPRGVLACPVLSAIAVVVVVVVILLCPGMPIVSAAEVKSAMHNEKSGSSAVDIDPTTGDQNTADQDTQWGPLSQYDRNLLINVRWANLWEGPTSEQVAQRTTNPKVRAVATQLSKEHHVLDQLLAETAPRLNVPMPDSPTPLQQAWKTEILSKTGNDADDAWANLTREAHGTIFLLIAQVRSTTRNDVMRSFAQTANEYVMRHMTLLESTALVRSSSLYVGSTDAAPYQILPSWNELVLGIVLGCFVLIGTFVIVRACARYEPRTATDD